jgi:PAS domain S-box-containing protein
MTIWAWFNSIWDKTDNPDHKKQLADYRRRMLRASFMAGIVGATIFTIYYLLNPIGHLDANLRSMVIVIIVTITLGVGLVTILINYVDPLSILHTSSALMVCVYFFGAVETNGVASPILAGMLLIVLLNGVLLSKRGTMLYGTLGLFSLLVLYALEMGGTIQPQPQHPLDNLLIALAVGVIATILIYQFSYEFFQLWRKLQVESQILDMASKRLQTEISDRQDFFEKLMTSEEKFRAMFDSSADIIMLMDADGHIIQDVNQHVESLLGYPVGDIKHKTLEDFLEIANPKHIDTEHANIHYNGVHDQIRAIPFLHANQDIILMMEIHTNVITWGDTTAILINLRDITERITTENELVQYRLRQQEMEANQELVHQREKLLSLISHQLRTPLTVMQMSGEMLEKYWERMSNDKREKQIHRILEENRKMTQMMDDLLIVRKGIAGGLQFTPERISLRTIEDDIIAPTVMIKPENITFELEITDASHEGVFDPKLLRHILDNLLSNAFKYSPDGGKVRCEIQAEENQDITFFIRDEGIGIPEEDLPHIFDLFHRAGNVDRIEGTGLGMAIVQQCVEAHGGHIDVTSEKGKGTCFKVRLPSRNSSSNVMTKIS